MWNAIWNLTLTHSRLNKRWWWAGLLLSPNLESVVGLESVLAGRQNCRFFLVISKFSFQIFENFNRIISNQHQCVYFYNITPQVPNLMKEFFSCSFYMQSNWGSESSRSHSLWMRQSQESVPDFLAQFSYLGSLLLFVHKVKGKTWEWFTLWCK